MKDVRNENWTPCNWEESCAGSFKDQAKPHPVGKPAVDVIPPGLGHPPPGHTPAIPEPATWGMLAVGLIAVALAARLRKR